MRNPFDRIFKNTVEAEARALLQLLGELPIDAPAEVTELGQEIGLEAVHLDHLFEVRTPDWHGLRHFEFQSRYQTNLPSRILDYKLQAWLRYRLPMLTVVVLPVQRYAPAKIPEAARIHTPELVVECRYRVVKMWELDPVEIFRLGRPSLLTLVPLAASTRDDLNRAARGIIATGNASLASQFVTLGGMRYDQEGLRGAVEEVIFEELLKPEWVRVSSVVQPLIAEAEREGRLDATRELLSSLLESRFPGLSLPHQIESLNDLSAIKKLFNEIAKAQTPDEAEAALQRTVPAER